MTATGWPSWCPALVADGASLMLSNERGLGTRCLCGRCRCSLARQAHVGSESHALCSSYRGGSRTPERRPAYCSVAEEVVMSLGVFHAGRWLSPTRRGWGVAGTESAPLHQCPKSHGAGTHRTAARTSGRGVRRTSSRARRSRLAQERRAKPGRMSPGLDGRIGRHLHDRCETLRACLFNADDVPTHRQQRNRDELEVGQAERDPDDGQRRRPPLPVRQ